MTAPGTGADLDSAGEALEGVLESLDDAKNYADWIVSLCEPWLGPRVLEVGAGTGTFTARWAEGRNVAALEPFPKAAERLAERVADLEAVTVVDKTIEDYDTNERFDTAVLVNVLEHLPDDRAAVRRLRELVQPGGNVVIYVPAHRWLMSDFDRAIGHYRRYSKSGLRSLARDTGTTVEAMHSVNLPGVLAWFIVARLAGKDPTHARFASTYDRFVVPLLRWVESKIHPPTGQSIFCVLRTPSLTSQAEHAASRPDDLYRGVTS